MTLTKAQAALGLGTAILAFAGAVAGATTWFSKRFAALDTRIGKLENAIKALNVTTSDEKYKELIKELLAFENSQAPARAKHSEALPVHTFGKTYPAMSGTSASAPAATKPPQ
jgi:hypothetical protein